MKDKRFDPFRYSVETVSPLVRKDLALMRVPELGAEELEPPAALKQRLDSLEGDASSPSDDLPSIPAAAPPAGPTASPPRRVSKAVLLALGFALASWGLALLRG